MKNEECSVEVFSRVTGFYRPVQSWNKGKTREFGDRSRFDLAKNGAGVCTPQGNGCEECGEK